MATRLFLARLGFAGWVAAVALSAYGADHSAPSHKATSTHGAPHWGYVGAGAPSQWGNIEPGFSLCKLGKQQSPVNIQPDGHGKPTPIDFAYAQSDADIVNNGHTVQINLKQAGGLTLDGVGYKLVQFHFHTPSEEKVRGQAYPLVAHLVHQSESGQLAVVAVLFELGDENRTLKEAFTHLPGNGHSEHLASGMNVSNLLPAYKGYYKMMGSLTTPPCSENVRWQILKQHVELSKAQLEAFRKLYKMNARPVQPLNGRKIEES